MVWQRRAKGREFIMPPRRTGFNEYMPQGQRTLTEVDGVVEIGPVGPATQKEVAPAQANNSRKRDAAEAAAQPAAARRAARGHATAAPDRNDRQPAATAAPQDFLAREVRKLLQFGVFLPYKIPGKSQSNNQNAAKNQRIKSHLNPTHPIPLQNEIKTIKIPG